MKKIYARACKISLKRNKEHSLKIDEILSYRILWISFKQANANNCDLDDRIPLK